jgi:hypothetical protein
MHGAGRRIKQSRWKANSFASQDTQHVRCCFIHGVGLLLLLHSGPAMPATAAEHVAPLTSSF